MKHLIIYAHPNPKSFNHAILETLQEVYKAKGHSLTVRDLYAEGFNPVLAPSDFEAMGKGSLPQDILREQRYVKDADFITFVYPIWWAGFPAVLKGYFDRVFLKGFAYDFDAKGIVGLLKGKKAAIINTTGTPEPVYNGSGMLKSLNQTSEQGIFGFCGVEVVAHRYFGAVPSVTPEQRKDMLAQIRALAEKF